MESIIDSYKKLSEKLDLDLNSLEALFATILLSETETKLVDQQVQIEYYEAVRWVVNKFAEYFISQR